MAHVGGGIAVAGHTSAPGRRGSVVDRAGMLVIETDDGSGSSLYPAPGSVTVAPDEEKKST